MYKWAFKNFKINILFENKWIDKNFFIPIINLDVACKWANNLIYYSDVLLVLQ